MTTPRFIAAAIQLCAGSDKAANLDKAESFVAEAARQAAALVVLPEVFLSRGLRSEERQAAEPIPGPSTERLSALARGLKIHLVADPFSSRAPATRYSTPAWCSMRTAS